MGVSRVAGLLAGRELEEGMPDERAAVGAGYCFVKEAGKVWVRVPTGWRRRGRTVPNWHSWNRVGRLAGKRGI